MSPIYDSPPIGLLYFIRHWYFDPHLKWPLVTSFGVLFRYLIMDNDTRELVVTRPNDISAQGACSMVQKCKEEKKEGLVKLCKCDKKIIDRLGF
jgi:hypothetical protein